MSSSQRAGTRTVLMSSVATQRASRAGNNVLACAWQTSVQLHPPCGGHTSAFSDSWPWVWIKMTPDLTVSYYQNIPQSHQPELSWAEGLSLGEMPQQAILGADQPAALRRGVLFHGKPDLVELGWRERRGDLTNLKRHNFMIESWVVYAYFLLL